MRPETAHMNSIPPDDAVRPFSRITVLGAGLIGGSIALSAQAAGLSVTVYDPSEATLRHAEQSGLLTDPSAVRAVRNADLVVLAGPVSTIPALYRKVRCNLPDGCIVTDTGSAKSSLSQEMGAGDERHTVVPGHPMAGKTTSGYGAADASLFDGCTWILTPAADTAPKALERVAHFVRQLGAGQVLVCSPDEHDEAAAAVSHIPQLVATLAAANAARVDDKVAGTMAMAAGGFRDTTRVAASPGPLWVAILASNREAVLRQLDSVLVDASDLRSAIDQGDWDKVERLFDQGNDGRERYESL